MGSGGRVLNASRSNAGTIISLHAWEATDSVSQRKAACVAADRGAAPPAHSLVQMTPTGFSLKAWLPYCSMHFLTRGPAVKEQFARLGSDV